MSLGVLLWNLAWWSVIPLALCAIPEFLIETKLSGDAFALSTGRAHDSRRLTYLEWVLTRDSHVKEVKLYGLGPLLLQRYRALFERFLTEDQKLSGGQWQKLAIARSFMRLSSGGGAGADLLILDEPTAAIDAAAEAALFERFQKLTVGRSAIIISHRFSTVRIADRIAVLEHGKLIELGSHAALLALKGHYAHLFELQAKGYQ